MSHRLFLHSIFSNARVWAFLKQVDEAEAQRCRSAGCLVLALPIGLVAGEVLALHIKAKQAELERVESETEIPVVAAEDGS